MVTGRQFYQKATNHAFPTFMLIFCMLDVLNKSYYAVDVLLLPFYLEMVKPFYPFIIHKNDTDIR